MASKSGIDYLLQQRGKSLKTGQELRIVLVKASGTRQQADPMDPSAPREDFPLIAKFGESTVRPNFKKMVRLHQQNVPGYKVRPRTLNSSYVHSICAKRTRPPSQIVSGILAVT